MRKDVNRFEKEDQYDILKKWRHKMKYFQLIFLVFCVSGAFGAIAVLEFPEPLRSQCQNVVRNGATITYENFSDILRKNLEALKESVAEKRAKHLSPLAAEDHGRFTVDVESLVGATAFAWERLKVVCPEEGKQNRILSVAMEFLENCRDKPGCLNGEEFFVNLATYMGNRDLESLIWDPGTTSVVALYYFMNQFPCFQGVDFHKIPRRRSKEEISMVMEFLRKTPKSFCVFFLHRNRESGLDVSFQTLVADMDARFAACFINIKR
jgi:hypothetical protein